MTVEASIETEWVHFNHLSLYTIVCICYEFVIQGINYLDANYLFALLISSLSLILSLVSPCSLEFLTIHTISHTNFLELFVFFFTDSKI